MTRAISFSIIKGGSGKTTTAVNLAALLPGNILLIDFDPQCNAGISLGVTKPKNTIYNMIVGESDFDHTVKKTEWCDLLPAGKDLNELDLIIAENRDVFSNPGHALKNAIADIIGQYDYILI